MTAQHGFREATFASEGPQPLVREIPPGEPYPVAALGPLAQAVQGATQAPVAIPAASALAVASLAVQGFADVETLGGLRPLSLYLLTIGRSGERKSSCDASLLAALRDHEKEQARAQRDAVASCENAHALWKGERTASSRRPREARAKTGLPPAPTSKRSGRSPSHPLRPTGPARSRPAIG